MGCTPCSGLNSIRQCCVPKAPQPERVEHEVHFGAILDQNVGDTSKAMKPPISVTDDYFWMRDDSRTDKKVLKHLKRENAYTNFKTRGLKSTVKKIYNEMLANITETDSSIPSCNGQFAYYTRTEKGKGYKIHCRKLVSNPDSEKERIVLDENELAKGKKYCIIGDLKISPCHQVVAYSVDFTGQENYSIRFRHIDSQTELHKDSIPNTSGFFEWGKDRNTIYYCSMDETQRANKVWRHFMKTTVGNNGEISYGAFDVGMNDAILFEECDVRFNVHISKSRSQRFVFITSASSNSSEQRFIDLNTVNPANKTKLNLIAEKCDNVIYFASHSVGNEFLILTNDNGASNFTVVKAEIGENKVEWEEFIPYDCGKSKSNLECFEKFSLIQGREDGLPCIWVVPNHDSQKLYKLDVFETLCHVEIEENLDYKGSSFRYAFSSLTTPKQVWEYNVETMERIMLKQKSLPNYSRERYDSKRVYAVSKDGTEVPITMVWNKDMIQTNGEPNFVHMYGYGSYQIPVDLHFSSTILPLLNRGVIYAIAHVRGGGEYGRQWYEQAKLDTKQKTFDDFIACAKYLINEKYTKEQFISIEGHSAGGLLMGAVINEQPGLFRACIAGVPFVDVLNTMSDSSIPLTTSEWLEWGNPHQKKFFEAIKNYCPYQNVHRQAYPAILAIVGLHDNRVLYSEAAKWVSKLRYVSVPSRDILLKVNISAGHFSDSSRYDLIKEKAFQISWILSELGILQLNKIKKEDVAREQRKLKISFLPWISSEK